METSSDLNKKSFRAGIWYIVSSFLVKGLSVLTIPIFSRMLSQEDYGVVSNFQSWVGILLIVLPLDLHASIQQAKLEKDINMNKYLSSILLLASISSTIFFIITNMFSGFVEDLLAMNMSEITFLYVYVLFYTGFQLIQVKQRVFLQYKVVTALTCISSVLSVLLSLILVAQLENKAFARIIGIYLPLTIIAVILCFYILIKGKFSFNKSYCRFALALSVPLIPHLLSGNILSQFDRIMITNIMGYSATGLYSMVYNFAVIMTIMLSSLNEAWSPWFHEQMHRGKEKEIREKSKPYILAFSVINFVVLAFAPEGLLLLAPIEYYEGVYIIPFILLGVFFQSMCILYINIQFFHKNTKRIPIGTVLAACLNVGLNYIFIPVYGYVAAAVTTLIGYLFLYVYNVVVTTRNYSVICYDKLFLRKVIVVNILLSGGYLFLYQTTVVRYIITTIIFVIVLIWQKDELDRLRKSFFRQR